MTQSEISRDIERGIQIRAEIAKLTQELKAIEARLQEAGQQGEQIPLQDPGREGKQFLARSSSRIIPVRFESDLIAASFDPDSIMHKEAADISGEHFPRFFKQSNKFVRVPEDGEDLRLLARQLLEPEKFALFIRAVTSRDKKGIAKSRIVVGWKDEKPIHA
jgi:hypothetical protein